MTKGLILVISLAGTFLVWWKLFHWDESPVLKVLIAVLAVFPVIGPIMCLWIVGMPDEKPPWLRGWSGRGQSYGHLQNMEAKMEQMERDLAESSPKKRR